ncbi:uncharacterized protein EI97DRAFT_436633 [Westerdykella ornata]|uniref:Uncharacterized protein n=1 Tax=Westerdykella ornata TaxID=318751 RepID=A0A6A6J944_WESOR|nr:uncharacterized protein EI97DRAFT_436633 [Westerdykella ornata]KAF2272865.1 hypothetical protein EI97DRAFT_436633 [Westerdykella ornata]
MPTLDLYLLTSVGFPRDHHSLFLLTDPSGRGIIFQVTGNIQEGMRFEKKDVENPELSNEYISKSKIGVVSDENLARMESVLRGIAPPTKQFDGPTRIDASVPLRRCQEWTREAVEALGKDGILGA